MNLDEFVKLFADQFEDTDPNEITPNCHFQDLEDWDSLAALGIIAFVKTECGKAINAREIRSCETVEDIFKLVESK